MAIKNVFKFTPTGKRIRNNRKSVVRGGGASVSVGSGGGGSNVNVSGLVGTLISILDRMEYQKEKAGTLKNIHDFFKAKGYSGNDLKQVTDPGFMNEALGIMQGHRLREAQKEYTDEEAIVLQNLLPSLTGGERKDLGELESPWEYYKGLTPEGDPMFDPRTHTPYPGREANPLQPRTESWEDPRGEISEKEIDRVMSNAGSTIKETQEEYDDRIKIQEQGQQTATEIDKNEETARKTLLPRTIEQVIKYGSNSDPYELSMGPEANLEKAIGSQLFKNVYGKDINTLDLDHSLLRELMNTNIDDFQTLYGSETGQKIIQSVFAHYNNTITRNYTARLGLGKDYLTERQKQKGVKEKAIIDFYSKQIIANIKKAHDLNLEDVKYKNKRRINRQKADLKKAIDKDNLLLAQNIAKNKDLDDEKHKEKMAKLKREHDFDLAEHKDILTRDLTIDEMKAKLQLKLRTLPLLENKNHFLLKNNETGETEMIAVGEQSGKASTIRLGQYSKLRLPLTVQSGEVPQKATYQKVQDEWRTAASLTRELGLINKYLTSEDGMYALTGWDKGARSILKWMNASRPGIKLRELLLFEPFTSKFAENQLRELRRFEQFRQNAENQFLRFRKFITGVAGGFEEMKQIKNAFFDIEEDDALTLSYKVQGLMKLQQRIYSAADQILKNNQITSDEKMNQLNTIVKQALTKSQFNIQDDLGLREVGITTLNPITGGAPPFDTNTILNEMQDILKKKGIN